jgi:release factor glutamine methyltransferase
MLLKDYKIYFLKQLENIHEKEEVETFFFMICEYLHDLKRVDLVLEPDYTLSESDTIKWNAILEDLKQEKPIQYILGEAWFYGLRFEVDEYTLIPRPETEELVEWIIESQDASTKDLKILDIGTGTGCIPISIKKNLVDATVYAIDVSENALEIAKKNAVTNDVVINFIQKDILKATDLEDTFDVIVSNPPYVRELEKAEINKNVLEYEPHLALFVSDTDALLFYRKIAQLATKHLAQNGVLFFEINQYLGTETVQLLTDMGYKNIELRQDFKGNDRMIRAEL